MILRDKTTQHECLINLRRNSVYFYDKIYKLKANLQINLTAQMAE